MDGDLIIYLNQAQQSGGGIYAKFRHSYWKLTLKTIFIIPCLLAPDLQVNSPGMPGDSQVGAGEHGYPLRTKFGAVAGLVPYRFQPDVNGWVLVSFQRFVHIFIHPFMTAIEGPGF